MTARSLPHRAQNARRPARPGARDRRREATGRWRSRPASRPGPGPLGPCDAAPPPEAPARRPPQLHAGHPHVQRQRRGKHAPATGPTGQKHCPAPQRGRGHAPHRRTARGAQPPTHRPCGTGGTPGQGSRTHQGTRPPGPWLKTQHKIIPGSGRAARRGADLDPIWRRHPSCSMFSQRFTR